MQNAASLLQVEAMQQRLACARLYLSWHSDHGRALDSLACSLKRRLYGPHNVYPMIDWDKCALSCEGQESTGIDLGLELADVDLMKLDDLDVKMQYLRQREEARTVLPF